MKRSLLLVTICLTAAALALNGCSDNGGGTADGVSTDGSATDGSASTSGAKPVFSLAWSEYPSWSVFGVADELGLIDGDEGKFGEIEEKWGVDIVLKEAGYDSCLNLYSTSEVDAVCMTNMDALIHSANRDAVAILPTSTSNGADACIVVGIDDVEALKKHKIYGLEGTVSEYCFVRCIEELGQKEEDYDFSNKDPAVAAVAMQTKDPAYQAIMVWNPFVLQTLNERSDAKVLFDSTKIHGEIVDMVVIGKDALAKPGAKKFASAIIDTFYRMNEELADPDSGDDVLVALGKKFSSLGLDDMKIVVEQTQFYKTPDEGADLLNGDAFKTIMKTVEGFCVSHGLVKNPTVGYGSGQSAKLVFDASYIDEVKGKN